MRSQLIQAKLGTLETTAVIVSNTVFLLAWDTKYWQQLRSFVAQRGDGLFTFDDLNSFSLLQNVLKERTFNASYIGGTRCVGKAGYRGRFRQPLVKAHLRFP
jgi:hypothetical protein